ncbi:hypothetical protein COCOR_03350 [Corallococcus coralloides DSM 2259]|uniref:Lipoprotein n=1 Tax=Corallococcus coralloides (strain ATCC 25202 / DSM 2259 / NBRC 100086 / M2) TaxID=1144275 RepID=H8MHY4_CORCM|nr:hypothetical protein [Corallococcus coralloides]AFE05170.1 hypothetical protein COCOR_03350 [Corallococcus coralloides DSM 2259]
MSVPLPRRGAWGCILLLLVAGCSRTSEDEGASETVSRELAAIVATCAVARGPVDTLRTANAYWEPFEAGATFRSGDWVRTGPEASTRIELRGGGRIELEERTVVMVERTAPPAGGGSVVALESGTARGLLPEDALPDGPLVLRGDNGRQVALTVEAHAGPTEFRVTRTARGMHLSVSRGRLLLSEGTNRRTLEAGNWLDVARGLEDAEHDGPPFPTSLSPGVDARIAWRPELRIPLSWKPLEGVRGYQVQVARDMGFTRRIVDTQVEGSDFTFVPPEPGMFVWRVSALDEAGRPGESGFARRVFVERKQPRGLLVTPPDGYQAPNGSASEDVVFAWQSIGGEPRYRLVVARDRELRQPVLVREGSPQQVVLSGLAPGEYFWGVYVAEDPPVPLFQKARRLVVPGPSGSLARDALLPMDP